MPETRAKSQKSYSVVQLQLNKGMDKSIKCAFRWDGFKKGGEFELQAKA